MVSYGIARPTVKLSGLRSDLYGEYPDPDICPRPTEGCGLCLTLILGLGHAKELGEVTKLQHRQVVTQEVSVAKPVVWSQADQNARRKNNSWRRAASVIEP